MTYAGPHWNEVFDEEFIENKEMWQSPAYCASLENQRWCQNHPWVQIPPSPQNWYGSINRRETAKGSLDKLSPVRVNPYKPKLLETPEMGLSTMSLALYRLNLQTRATAESATDAGCRVQDKWYGNMGGNKSKSCQTRAVSMTCTVDRRVHVSV